METKKTGNGKTVTLKDLWDLFVRRLWVMAAVAVACILLLLIINQITFTPRYESTATLYILRQGESDSADDAAEDFSLSLKVVNDCTYFLKSHTVLDQVIENLDLDMSYRQLYSSVSTYNPDNTRILELTVEADTPEQAKEIADMICSIGPKTIAEAMGYEQVQLFEKGILESEPSNAMGLLAYLLIGFIAAVGTYCVFLVMFLMDDRIQSDEDVQRILGLSVLGSIPDADSVHHVGYGYGAYGARTSGSKSRKRRGK